MTWTVNGIKGDDVLARDGSIGTLDDVYFDDCEWNVRYMVVDTGGWVPGRRILIGPQAVEGGLSDPGKLRIGATREELKGAPVAQSEPPLSQQMRIARAKDFGPPYYWTSPALWGAAALPGSPIAGAAAGSPSPSREEAARAAERMTRQGDPHLRSSREIIGYDVRASDGSVGKVDDFLIDEADWKVLGLVVDTTRWWPGGEVRVAPEAVERIDWAAREVRVRMTREELKAGARA